MTNATDYQAVLTLLGQVPRPPEAGDIAGATDEQLDRVEKRVGVPLPAQLREWLRACNGVIAGPGVLLGADTANPDLDLASTQLLWPEWQERKFLPVATDGTGNGYVLDALADGPDGDAVYFVDCSEDPGVLAYVAASSLPRFLTFLLEKELGGSGWPFDADYVLTRDSDITAVTAAPLPWLS